MAGIFGKDKSLMGHTPVLLKLVIESLSVKKGAKYIDATFGEGGYSKAIIGRGGEVLAIDLDKEQIERGKTIFAGEKKIKFHWANFSQLKEIAAEEGFVPVEGIVFDLGLSYRQIRDSGRGFSYRKIDEPLDMRLNLEGKLTARDIVNSFGEEYLYEIFSQYSEELDSWSISRAIVCARRLKKIKTARDLIEAIERGGKKISQGSLARIFQSLRIAVNNDLENLRLGLAAAMEVLSDKGRLVVVSFHSREDRIVKQFIRDKKLKDYKIRKKRSGRRRKFERSAVLRVFGK